MLDASALVPLLVRRPADTVAALQRRTEQTGENLHAPHLVDLEVTQVLRRDVQRQLIGADEAAEALRVLLELPLTRHIHWPLLRRIWELRHNVTPYDAAYIALSEALDAPLLTLDRRLAAASGHHANVEVF